MSGRVRAQGERVRQFILDNVGAHESDLVAHVAGKFSITRQAVNKHLQKLNEQGAMANEGTTRAPRYRLTTTETLSFSYPIRPGLAEDRVWARDIKPTIDHLPGNVLNIWNHGFTEMFNNAIDHAGASKIDIGIARTAITTTITVTDDGVGIFRKIQRELDLLDERQAIFELSKGKLTTDPKRHSGEGIFFTSRMFDHFAILSGGLLFDHRREARTAADARLERAPADAGTRVVMELNNHTARTTKKVFDEFSSGDDYGFTKTVVPVDLANYGQDELVSRSQAKRVLARVDLFETVVFDFKGVDAIGQAFADEIFRVFANDHPDIRLVPVHMSKAVEQMVKRAIAKA